MKKIGKALLAILGIFVVLVVLFNIKRIIAGIDKFKYVSYKEGEDYFLEEIDYETENEEILKSQPSEIEGMTRYDKLQAGLSPYLEDTDRDGISDVDELAMGTDPTKASTSGDMYPDGYKLLHDMDLNTYYEFEPDSVELNGIRVEEISVDISCAEDFNGIAEECEKEDGYKGVYKIYKISGFQGTVSIDLSSILDENNVTIDDIEIQSRGFWNQGDLEDCKYAIDGTVISFDIDFCQETKYLYILNSDEYDVEASDSYEGRAIIFGSPIFRIWGKGKFNIWYIESGDEALDEKVLTRMKEEVSKVTDAGKKGQKPVSDEFDNIEIKKIPEIDFRLRVMQYILPMFECDNSKNMKLYQLLYYYSDYSDIVAADAELAKSNSKKSKNSTSRKFDFSKDILPFGNFASEISHDGNCAGIATLTARTFNGNFIPASGEYDIHGKGYYVWDISGDNDNKTLRDAYLSDYKDADFRKNHLSKYKTSLGKVVYLLDKDLSEGEKQFMYMIGCYWSECNDALKSHSDYAFLPTDVKYSCNRIEATKKYLDGNKILIAGFAAKGFGGHAINIVGYEDLPDGNIKLLVYDNNFPDETQLYILIQPKGDGTFDYIYKTPKYEFSSLVDGSMFLICDDNYKELASCIWSVDQRKKINNKR